MTSTPAWHQRLHAALMPDYNRSAATYWWLATTGGGALLVGCLVQVGAMPAMAIVQVALGLALAVCAGLFPVRVPGTRVSFAAGEVCMFLVLLLHGPAAAAVAAAGEAAMGSYRTSKRWTSRLGSPAMATLAMYGAGSLFSVAQAALLEGGAGGPVPLLMLAMGVALVYFVFSATLMSGTGRLRRGERLLQLADVVSAFRWVGLAYAGSAALATLLYLVYLQAGPGVLLVMLPLLAMLLLVLHFYFRQQETVETLRLAQAEAATREAAMQAREAEAAQRHGNELHLSGRRFRSAFTHAWTGMALMDLDGHLIESNPALARLVEREAQALAGVPFARLIHFDDAPLFEAKLVLAHGVDFEAFVLPLRLMGAGGRAHRTVVECSFFGGPAAHGSAQAGKPCLFLQVLDFDARHLIGK